MKTISLAKSLLRSLRLPPRLFLTTIVAGASLACLSPSVWAEGAAAPENGSEITVTGEVLDLVCYIDHNATGADHSDCAQRCIKSGLPVGIKDANGTVYLLVGEHKPANEELAQHAAQTITVTGKYVTRDGIKLLENIDIVKN